jgi:transcriptional regulator with XRE-family HTH domain
MIADNGGELREWRRSRGWDVPELARRLRRAADEPVAAHDGLVRMIRAWERGDHHPSERYELLYRRLGLPPRDKNEPEPTDTGNQEGTRPVRRRTFVELTGISLAGALLPGATGTSPATGIESLVLMLTGASPESSATPPDLRGLTLSVTRASQLDTARRCLDGDNRRRACALSADAYHVAAGFLLETGDPGLAHVATDRSMTAALASQDPLTVGASGRILTHTLMSSGHPSAAVTTAQDHAARLDRETGITTPESQSVYGSLLLRGALAAAQHGQRGTAQEMLTEAADAARQVGTDANLRGTAFGPVNTAMHQVNVAVTLGDAGTAIDLARRIDLRAVTVTERKASPLIDVARAYFQWGKYEQAHASLRAAEDTAPQEVATRPAVATLARDLATLAPVSIRRDAEQFASRIGVPR